MINIKVRLLCAVILTLSLVAGAIAAGTDEPPPEDDMGFLSEAPDDVDMEGAEELPLVLDPIVVSDIGISFRQEVTMRIIRQAYNAPRSERLEDIDNWICWIIKPTGTHFGHLACARNCDLWANRPTSAGGTMRAGIGKAGYGKIMRTSRPTNRWKLEKAMAALPGSSDFDKEFVSMVMAGQQPPRDIPDDEELDQFAKAWVQIGKLHKAGMSDDEQVVAIEDEGLSLKRYNRIAELVETYQSVENQVDERIKRLN